MNQLELPLKGEFAIVRDALLNHADGFASHGFELAEVTLVEGSAKIQTFPVFEFRNQRTGMTIRVSFSAARDGLKGGFGVRIVDRMRRRLNVEDYLRLHGRSDLAERFRYRDPETDICSFANSFLQLLFELLNTELKPILAGETFEETAIDWMGYK